MASEVSIISNAFVLLGSKAINAFDDNNNTHIAARRLYDQLKPELIQMHGWRFAINSKQLDLLTETPIVDDWNYAFSFPINPTSLLLYRPRPLVDFEIFNSRIYANVNSLKMDYLYLPDESDFPYYFTSALTYYLSARLALNVSQRSDLVQYWDRQAAKMIAIAQSTDALQYPNKAIQVDYLYSAHFVSNSAGG